MMNSQKKTEHPRILGYVIFVRRTEMCLDVCGSLSISPLVFLEKSLEVDEVLETLRAQQAASFVLLAGVWWVMSKWAMVDHFPY